MLPAVQLSPSSPFVQSTLNWMTAGLRRTFADFPTVLRKHIDFDEIAAWGPRKEPPVLILGAAYALNNDDWLVTCYRENCGLFWRGVPKEAILLHWMGDERGTGATAAPVHETEDPRRDPCVTQAVRQQPARDPQARGCHAHADRRRGDDLFPDRCGPRAARARR